MGEIKGVVGDIKIAKAVISPADNKDASALAIKSAKEFHRLFCED